MIIIGKNDYSYMKIEIFDQTMKIFTWKMRLFISQENANVYNKNDNMTGVENVLNLTFNMSSRGLVKKKCYFWLWYSVKNAY